MGDENSDTRLNKAITSALEKLGDVLDYYCDIYESRSQVEGFSSRAGVFFLLGPIDMMSSYVLTRDLRIYSDWNPGSPISVIINSPGGSVFDGFAIYDTLMSLRSKGHKITTYCLGNASSMASLIFQAGTERVMYPHAYLMIHELRLTGHGTSRTSEAYESYQFLKDIQDRGLQIIAERCTLDKDEIEKRWLKTDWFLCAEEAVKIGLADRIEEVANAVC